MNEFLMCLLDSSANLFYQCLIHDQLRYVLILWLVLTMAFRKIYIECVFDLILS